MPAFDPPPYVQQRTTTLDELSIRADPNWPRTRNYARAYKFPKGRVFIGHRDDVYQVTDMAPDEDGRP